MLEFITKFIIIFILMFAIHMIYFYFRNKSKKYGELPTIEMMYIKNVYGVRLIREDKKYLERHISLINAFIVTVDMLIYFYMESMILKLVIMFFATVLLVYIMYRILARYYKE